MMLKKCGLLMILLSGTLSHAQVVQERAERVTERNGVYEVCGNGEGMSACRDRNGLTYDEETRGPDVQAETNDELANQAARIRNESPEELNATISEMEQGVEPDGY